MVCITGISTKQNKNFLFPSESAVEGCNLYLFQNISNTFLLHHLEMRWQSSTLWSIFYKTHVNLNTFLKFSSRILFTEWIRREPSVKGTVGDAISINTEYSDSANIDYC